MNAGLMEPGQEIILPAGLMSLKMYGQLTAYGQHLFRGRHGVWGSLTRPCGNLATETRDSDHEEFVEIRGEDCQELDALQKRMSCIFRFLQHTQVELKPAELSVQEQTWAIEVRGCFGRSRQVWRGIRHGYGILVIPVEVVPTMTGLYKISTDYYRGRQRARSLGTRRADGLPHRAMACHRAERRLKALVGRTRVTMRKGSGGSNRLVRYFLIKLPVFSLAS